MHDLQHILNLPAPEAAQRLLGCYLVRTIGGQRIIGKIVETEAYDQADAASHSYKGKTARTEVMFGPAGRLYVYFTYGMHYCCNVVCGPEGQGAAVLIRALEPVEGADIMSQNRHGLQGPDLANGPAKLCQALNITKQFNGHDLTQSPVELIIKSPVSAAAIVKTTRIGISRAQNKRWRFYICDNKHISRP